MFEKQCYTLPNRDNTFLILVHTFDLNSIYAPRQKSFKNFWTLLLLVMLQTILSTFKKYFLFECMVRSFSYLHRSKYVEILSLEFINFKFLRSFYLYFSDWFRIHSNVNHHLKLIIDSIVKIESSSFRFEIIKIVNIISIYFHKGQVFFPTLKLTLNILLDAHFGIDLNAFLALL